MPYRVADNVAHRTKATSASLADPVEYEKEIYQRGLQFERPPFTFQSSKWEEQAELRMSAKSKGYVVDNAGTGETAQKNREAFAKWSIVPKRLVKASGLPNLSTKIMDQEFPFPIAIAPAVGDKLDIFFDFGIRAGADIAKAMALGARMCLVGRPYIYGLALGGEEGVSHVLKSLLGDLEVTLHLAGIQSASPAHLKRYVLEREDKL